MKNQYFHSPNATVEDIMDEFNGMDKDVMAEEILRLRNKVYHQEDCIERQRDELTDFQNGRSKSEVRAIQKKKKKALDEVRKRFPNAQNKK